MSQNPIRAALAERGCAVGPWLTIADPAIVTALGAAGCDFVLADGQHAAHDLSNLLPLGAAAQAAGAALMVRVPWSEPWMVMRALDFGAAAVLVPMVSTIEQATSVARAMRYPPHGERSYGPKLHADGDPYDLAHGPVCLVMIETQEGLDNVEQIAAVPGIDGLFLGPVDMGFALGEINTADDIPAGINSVRSLEAVDRIVAAANDAGIAAAAAVFGSAHEAALARAGMRIQVARNDVELLTEGARARMNQLRGNFS